MRGRWDEDVPHGEDLKKLLRSWLVRFLTVSFVARLLAVVSERARAVSSTAEEVFQITGPRSREQGSRRWCQTDSRRRRPCRSLGGFLWWNVDSSLRRLGKWDVVIYFGFPGSF
jgi:hypothetical protein